MKRSTKLLVIIIVLLLLSGWIIFRVINRPDFTAADTSGFRAWFWENRGLDLAVQVMLVFAGTLGIAAILPIEEEDD